MDWIIDIVLVYLINASDVFFHGMNPGMDVLIKAANFAVYQKNMTRSMKSIGWIPLHEESLLAGSHTDDMTQEEKDLVVSRTIMMGEGIYGSELAIAVWPFVKAFW